MPSYYEAVGVEPTYELAESIIKATTQRIDIESSYGIHPRSSICVEFSLEVLGYVYVFSLPTNERSDTAIATHLIIKHFPDVLKKHNNALYIKESDKHLLCVNDLLVMEYYLLLLNQHEERVNKYQHYLKKQQDRQRNKLLFVLFLPFILFVLMILVGD